ncbi:ABC transporter permease [Nocardia sp. CDC159]|uniref:Autoinducer 2 import system permease protein LsrD n=1 Tax=Nocardia pulmonis TaxID=2951408 RepID=A0A9X2E338_9NOCA|nr:MULTISPECIES: ABC transporter permease [Nocardia]MCM6773014.1 ABC transporter permease [Nocardia pulmonis]MCM6785683.1 ABC transporter permease [Nocardia sp. CDC159]
MTDPASPAARLWAGIVRLRPYLGAAQGYIGLLLVIAFGIISKGQYFWNQTNLTNAIAAFSARGILAVGVTLVILTAGIDLSVGSIMGIGALTSALLLVDHDLSPWLIVPCSALVGAFFGLCNGLGTTVLRVQSFVMTLAMLSIVRGLDRQISGNVAVGTAVVDENGQPTERAAEFAQLGTPGHTLFEGTWLPFFGRAGIAYPVLAFVLVCVVFQLVLTKTRFGRHIYAVGGNPTAARLSGVNVTLVVVSVFTLSGMLAGFAGPIDAAYRASADPLAGTGYELDAIAAAVIGGASLAGGKGTITGTFVGALILTLLDNVLGLNGVSANAQLIIKGLIVVVAVVLQRPDLFRRISFRSRE